MRSTGGTDLQSPTSHTTHAAIRIRIAISLALGLTCTILAPAPTHADETVIEVTYSHRRVPDLDPPGTLAGGSILTTFRANNPIDLATPDPTVTRLDANTFTFVFLWDRQTPKTVDFRDDADQILTVVAWPTPVHPFDVSAHTAPVFHIQTEPTNLWDHINGIYVWGANHNCFQSGVEWERPAMLTYYGSGSSPTFSEAVGMRIHGGSSRYRDQKSLRFYFDEYGDVNQIDADLFGNPPTSFRRLLLRTCASPEHTLNTNLVESLYGDLGHLVSRQAFVAVYVNEEYWGGYNLRERFDREFFEHTRGLGDNEYIAIKDGYQINGDVESWWNLLNSFVGDHDYTAHDWYTDMEDQIDLTSYIDWLFFNIFVATSDNGHANNLVLFQRDGGKWQFIAWDQDSIFFELNLRANHLRFFAAANHAEYNLHKPERYADSWTASRQRWHTMFRCFLQNSEFKAGFYSRVDSLLTGPLSAASLSDRIAAFEAVQGPEMEWHGERWGWDDDTPYREHADYLRWFVTERHTVVDSLLADFRPRFQVPVELSEFSAGRVAGGVQLAWRTESEIDNLGFVVYRSTGDADHLEALASYTTHPELVGRLDADTPNQYTFSDTEAAADSTYYYQLRHVDVDGTETTRNWLENVWPAPWAAAVFNELMAANTSVIADEAGDYDDWFELHNAGDTAIDLGGMCVTDDPDDPQQHQLGDDLTIPPGGYLLLWADGETDEGPRHCGFNLSAAGVWLGLFAPDGITLFDSVTFARQLPDASYARQVAGDPPWAYSADPTPGQQNVAPETGRLLRLNELLAINETTISDEAGEFDPWLELYNPLPVEVPVAGLVLEGESVWPFPDTFIAASGYLLVWLDGEPQQGPLHADLELDAGGDLLGFYTVDGRIIEMLSFGPQATDIAWGRVPDGEGEWTTIDPPTPGTANPAPTPPVVLFINEFLADNEAQIFDRAGDYDDWLELYNPGPEAVALAGFHLTDDLDEPDKWALPDYTMQPESWLLIWCDNEPEEGPRHASFKLNGDGEEIGLFAPSSMDNLLVDSHIYGSQTTDVSEARVTDGSVDWEFCFEPTPGSTNGSDPQGTDPPPETPPPPPAVVKLHGAYPNPFNGDTMLRYDVPAAALVSLAVYDLRGRLVTSLVSEEQPAGSYTVPWSGLDRYERETASGVYFVRLFVGAEVRGTKVLRLK